MPRVTPSTRSYYAELLMPEGFPSRLYKFTGLRSLRAFCEATGASQRLRRDAEIKYDLKAFTVGASKWDPDYSHPYVEARCFE